MNRKAFVSKLVVLAGLITIISGLLLFYPQLETKIDATNETDITQLEDASLEEKLAVILDNPNLEGGVTGISVLDAANGDQLFSRNGDIRLHPASNMKILTAASALETLGPDYRFTTEVLTEGKIRGKVLHGDVYVKGKGDPTLLQSDLEAFAKELKKQGIQKIKGDLVGDDTWYDDVRLSQDLNWSDEPFYTGAQVSALTMSPDDDYDAGTVIVEVSPSKKGKKAEVTVTPENNYITIENKTKMVANGEEKDISIERQHGNNTIVIEGEMPKDGSLSRSWASVWEPTSYVISVFRQTLEDEGITFIGKSKDRLEETPASAKVLVAKESMPLKELLVPFMKLSNNGHGETLVKEMGKMIGDEGSWDEGLAVMEDVLGELGLNMDTILLRDGSGMSHKNLIPAVELSELLYVIQDKDWFTSFQTALPVAGHPERMIGGTLRNRMTDSHATENAIAKTGSITGVSTLSGYVTTADGEEVIFSILINNFLGSSATIRSIEDSIVNTIAGHEF
ncbi:D-alanyl-D-alanine carboxypeptidase/D-alanyl-D-alanine-endopeptidase [Oceanobacillus kimchii]|uniref:D-alanyl-D-alanine carboxypeptidase/D-alanyl-D-alanine endopeptidase n=1 Tax=Oceanobacillus kimchii TaxID=746691 RepID=UPI0003473F81|nr:D-alanyl-D-alanine carboxypeptidase/D-alanyl-D-alanine-endopeptidase [Oceanobacillus kimchii]MCT1576798.1 D-alanyl-D-alanine carboxypeptidase/D-alanyl-D-alanine-endopeptidase [Oceanobacillus kimchii]MCT2134868.1 D-alanyl-D-alanine carboxypeptidase/D-alanyl-D-alanine-endopeptidase [Oceanobacillus kimchii]